MKSYLTIFTTLFLICSFGVLSAHPHPGPYNEPMAPMAQEQQAEQIIGATAGVIFYSVNLYNENGHNYGLEVWAENQTGRDKEVTIEMTQSDNVSWNFPQGWFIIRPGQKLYVGNIKQSELSKEWSWYINWWVR